MIKTGGHSPPCRGLLRASNTQPALVMRFEARDEASLKKIQETVEGELRKVI
jgi:phosphomannomutase